MRGCSSRSASPTRGALLVLLSTVSPLPTKLVCIGAGAFGVPSAPFVLALAAGRVARFAAVGLALRFAGERVAAMWLGQERTSA